MSTMAIIINNNQINSWKSAARCQFTAWVTCCWVPEPRLRPPSPGQQQSAPASLHPIRRQLHHAPTPSKSSNRTQYQFVRESQEGGVVNRRRTYRQWSSCPCCAEEEAVGLQTLARKISTMGRKPMPPPVEVGDNGPVDDAEPCDGVLTHNTPPWCCQWWARSVLPRLPGHRQLHKFAWKLFVPVSEGNQR
jgi:hypothetical protein